MINYPKKIYTKKYIDKRGFFKEIFKQEKIKDKFVFDCMSKSKKNVFRGLHLQTKKQQAKFITVLKGEIIDYAVNVKKNSKDFGKVYRFKLNEDSPFSIYIPKGYAHGFLCLSKSCCVYYKCSEYRHKKSEKSISYKILKIKNKKMILSKKDQSAYSIDFYKKNI